MRASVDRQRESTEMAKIIRESPTEVYILKRDTLRFVEVNYGTCNNLGYTREEMLELTPVELTPHEHIGPLKESLRPLGDFDVDRLEFHTVHFRKDGSTYPVQVVLHRATYHDEPVYVAFVNDLTQVKLLEQQLAQAQKLESIGQLAAGLAHEINTPMQFIADNVDFLATSFRRLMEFTDTYKQLLFTNEQKAWQQRRAEIQAASEINNVEYHSNEMVAAIQESQEGIQRVVEIARAMKEFSHPGGKEKVRANINDVIRSTATISRNRWKYTAELVLDLDPDLPAVPLLVSEINQVLLNLMVNASDAIAERFADQPDTLGTVTVRTRSVDDGIAIEVEDNGGGIPEEVRDRIFDPFFTTKEVGKGTGQGLSICRNVVNKQHGGRMSVESTPGTGTIFTVWLPMQAPDVGSAQQFREVSGCQDVLAEACS
nr:ATP-binding protein [Aeoliella straminimaris]